MNKVKPPYADLVDLATPASLLSRAQRSAFAIAGEADSGNPKLIGEI
jgi:hypothetical protein